MDLLLLRLSQAAEPLHEAVAQVLQQLQHLAESAEVVAAAQLVAVLSLSHRAFHDQPVVVAAKASREILMPTTSQMADHLLQHKPTWTSDHTWLTCKEESNALGFHQKVMNPRESWLSSKFTEAASSQT